MESRADVPAYRVKVLIDYSQWRGLDLMTGKEIEFPKGSEVTYVKVEE